MPYKGLLDRLDRMDRVLLQIDLSSDDPKLKRENQIRLTNARMELVEVRRMIERAGQETKT